MRAVPNSPHDDVADRLRTRIFEGGLHAGAFIDEAALCTEWANLRSTLREALKVLAAETLMRHEPRRGSFVSEVTGQDPDEIVPVIALLEGRCAFEATRKATAADIAALDTLHDSLQAHAEARRIPDYYAANYSFHDAIVTLADNRWLLAHVIADLRKPLELARLFPHSTKENTTSAPAEYAEAAPKKVANEQVPPVSKRTGTCSTRERLQAKQDRWLGRHRKWPPRSRNPVGSVASAGVLSPASALTRVKWPAKPVTLVLPFPTVGGTDAFARRKAGQFSMLTGIKAFMVPGTKRSPAFPDVPSAVDLGLSRYTVTTRYGLWAPKGTPADVQARLVQELNRLFAADEIKTAWADNGAEFGKLTPAQFGTFVSAEIKLWATVVKASGAKLD